MIRFTLSIVTVLTNKRTIIKGTTLDESRSTSIDPTKHTKISTMAITKILIDNGHGENTPGKRSPRWSNGSQLLEWSYTREIANRLHGQLNAHRMETELLVKESFDVPLSERARRANAIVRASGVGNCLLVSIHCNAATGLARGWEVHVYKRGGMSDLYALFFYEEATAQMKGFPMRRKYSNGNPAWDSNFAILRDTVCTAVLTENLFMDNELDCRYLLSAEGKQTIVEIHLNAILKIAQLR